MEKHPAKVDEMNERTLEALEFHKVLEQLAGYASSSLGREKALGLRPFREFEAVAGAQSATREGATVLRLKGAVPLSGMHDIRPHLSRAKIGGMLSPQELLEVAETLAAGRRLKRFLESVHEEEPLPLLASLAERIDGLKEVEDAIRACIDDHGEVLDSASPGLRSVRQEIRHLESGIRQKLDQMLHSAGYQKMIQEAVVTIRNGRYVIPVKQEYRGHFGGIVHDQSASGATLFVEPEAVVLLNNRLRETKAREEREVEKILRSLSANVGGHFDAAQANVEALAELDFIFAKAGYAVDLRATEPSLNRDGFIRLKKGRHPLIPREKVVPIDVELGRDFTALIITGPNTGGKTVSLKTIGLLTLMAQAGLHIPGEEGCEIAVFDGVFADIGDEQSIEQNLSTFSSHMTNIIRILAEMTPRSLVLLDELGAGTDPTEGAALAMAILDQIHRAGARVVATTHYSELKAYAYNHTGAMNASVEFDVETLSPTYRLLVGIPGRSNAFAIASRLGLDQEIIEKAKSLIDQESKQVESMLFSLEQNRKEAEEERIRTKKLRQETEALKEELEKERERLEKERGKILQRAAEEADAIVRRARREAEEIIAELRRLAREEAGNVKEHRLIEAKKRLEGLVPRMEAGMPAAGMQDAARAKHGNGQRKIRPGDEVLVLSLGMKGTVLEPAGDDQFHVQVGIMKIKADRRDLVVQEGEKRTAEQAVTAIRRKGNRISPELDLRGQTVDEALYEVDKYLDEAMLAGLHQVTIIHGLGTGALRKAVQEYLRQHRAVKGFRSGGLGEGGSGVTVVELK